MDELMRIGTGERAGSVVWDGRGGGQLGVRES